jgi:hypothetical protein
MTWPVAAGLARDVPSDLGDPLLNCWILAWNARHVLRLLGGDAGALAGLWHGNIFHPAPYTLAMSELLATQSVLGLPLYALSGNIVLTYNVLFLSAFVLSGLGMFLFVRAIAADWRPAFLAGLLFAFTPYRINQAPHLQVMWSCWMPFVLYGLRRYFDASPLRPPHGPAQPLEGTSGPPARAWTWLAFAAVTLLAQNLSCGYYMIFFAPVVALYALTEMATRGRLLHLRTWTALAATAIAAILLTLPFMTGYFALRAIGQEARGLGQVTWFSADAYSYLTAHPEQRAWTWLQAWPKPEGALFPGAVPIALGAAALVAALAAARRAAGREGSRVSRWRERLGLAAGALAALYVVLAAGMFVGLEGRHRLGPIEIRLFDVSRLAGIALVAGGLAVGLSPRLRAGLVAFLRQPALPALAIVALAFWLSLGPAPAVGGNPLRDATIYGWLYTHVPGLDALRVPARFAMLVFFGLAWAAGHGYQALAARRPRAVLPLACAVALIDATAVPLGVNGPAYSDTHRPPPTRVTTAPTPLTSALAALPDDAVVLAFPFGDVAWEIRQVYLSTFHWRRLVNGYSGDFPPAYIRLRQALAPLPEEAQPHAWPLLRGSGATHVVVMGQAYEPARLEALRRWLEAGGARLERAVGGDLLFTLLPPVSSRPTR